VIDSVDNLQATERASKIFKAVKTPSEKKSQAFCSKGTSTRFHWFWILMGYT